MLFKVLDENIDGKISREEIAQYLSEVVSIVKDGFDKKFQEMQYGIALAEQEELFKLAEETFH